MPASLEALPVPGQIVRVRSRHWLVEDVAHADLLGRSPLVTLACADEDAQGQPLKVYWDLEPDRSVLRDEDWTALAASNFDQPDHFAAYLHTLRWGCVTATDPRLFQAPFRAGIQVDPYQMEPLRKALRLPRVTLFIADDTGLGKTIEAGLIARELLLRRKARHIVVAAPPSVLPQWRAELEERFGLRFEILDRDYVARVRRERGFGTNPWRTHSRFLVSHHLLADEAYAGGMEEWLKDQEAGGLFILDEAHHAAPSSGGRYGIESKLTQAIRRLAPRFEHRLFLSATPHNGHSNSFSTLMELLDPYRFTRGVAVRKQELDLVMVRRLKEDLRMIQGDQGGFPKREIQRIVIDNLPADAPELVLSDLLDRYRSLRAERFADATKRDRAASGLLTVGLQQRLLSSIEAFSRTLAVHRRTVAKEWAKEMPDAKHAFLNPSEEADDPENRPDEDALDAAELAEETAALESLSAGDAAQHAAEQNLLEEMQSVAERHRHAPDAKLRRLLAWIRDNLVDQAAGGFNHRRVLIFTENRQGTKRWLQRHLLSLCNDLDAPDALATLDGGTPSADRQDIQRRFNADPREEPLRILLATDAAREGLNLQAFCTDLFHFDLPWNPGRIEQRNGRIDRKLQPAPVVRCHYFVLPQRVEDRVLDVLVTKTSRIRAELGSLSRVLEDTLEQRLKSGGIRHADADALATEIDAAAPDAERARVQEEELGAARDRQDKLREQIARCERALARSRDAIGFRADAFRDALSSALDARGAPPLTRTEDAHGSPAWLIPDLAAHDASWAPTLDTLRSPRPLKESLRKWRSSAPIRPVVFEDAGELTDKTVHLHLEQRVADRLLARFRSRGHVEHAMARACVLHADVPEPRVVLHARLCLYGQRAERLHEALVPLVAPWSDTGGAGDPFAADGRPETAALTALAAALLAPGPSPEAPSPTDPQGDVARLSAALQARGETAAAKAEALLNKRGAEEADALTKTLHEQRDRVRRELDKAPEPQMALGFNPEEKQQLRADRRAWEQRLAAFDEDLEDQPAAVRSFYAVKATRTEPVGLVYLFPR